MALDARDIFDAAREQGWRIERVKKGWMLYPPDLSKPPVAWHGSPSDIAAVRNFLSQMRRSGLIWPTK